MGWSDFLAQVCVTYLFVLMMKFFKRLGESGGNSRRSGLEVVCGFHRFLLNLLLASFFEVVFQY